MRKEVSHCAALLCAVRVPKSAFGRVAIQKHTHTAHLVVRRLAQEGNGERQRKRPRERESETEGKTAHQGHWGFPLCRIRKDMRSR